MRAGTFGHQHHSSRFVTRKNENTQRGTLVVSALRPKEQPGKSTAEQKECARARASRMPCCGMNSFVVQGSAAHRKSSPQNHASGMPLICDMHVASERVSTHSHRGSNVMLEGFLTHKQAGKHHSVVGDQRHDTCVVGRAVFAPTAFVFTSARDGDQVPQRLGRLIAFGGLC